MANAEANAVFCARLTTGWRVSSVARSWYPTSLGSANNIITPSPREVRRPPSGLLRDATISRLAPAPAKRVAILPSPKGNVMAQMRRIFLIARLTLQSC